MYQNYIKRILDIGCAVAALLVFCWLFALVALLVRIKLGSPVLFTQDRPGKDEKIFKLYKFRKELIGELLARGCEVFLSLPDGEFILSLIHISIR